MCLCACVHVCACVCVCVCVRASVCDSLNYYNYNIVSFHLSISPFDLYTFVSNHLISMQQDSYSSEETKQDVFEFPPPKDININMMPFILSYDFKDSKLPKYLEPYWKFIERCSRPEKEKINSMWFNRDSSQLGKVCYLTIQESMVETLKSQRRPGLHVDCPGNVKIRETSSKEKGGEGGRGDGAQNVQNVMNSDGKEGDGVAKRYRDHHRGLGGCYFVPPQLHVSGKDSDSYLRSFEIRGGIFMASSVEESCRAWNCKIVPEEGEGEEEKKGKNSAAKDTEKENDDTKDTTSKQKSNQSGGREAIGKLGNIEHLRHLLPEELAQVKSFLGQLDHELSCIEYKRTHFLFLSKNFV